jgi:hypothetical protein
VIEIGEGDPRAAAVDPAAPRLRGAPLDEGAAIREAATLDGQLITGAAQPAVGNPAVETATALGPNATFHSMTKIEAALFHVTNLWPGRDSCQPRLSTRFRARAL